MAREDNFLLGRGELLVQQVSIASGGGTKNPPYTFQQAKARVASKLTEVRASIESLPAAACPRDETVAVVTVHPRYLSKTDYPHELLETVGLRAVGSRPKRVKPDAWGVKKWPENGALSEQIFVAGKRTAFTKWAREIESWDVDDAGAKQLQQLEDIVAFEAAEKVRGVPSGRDDRVMLEVVLHNDHGSQIVRSFLAYATSLKAEVLQDRRRDVEGLTFLPVRVHKSRVQALAKFSFVRVARGMPTLRPYRPAVVRAKQRSFPFTLPTAPALDRTTRVAIFDGGLPDDIDLSSWVDLIDAPDLADVDPDLVEHGLAVTGAYLFGPLSSGEPPPRPFSRADHIRVLDENTKHSELEYVDVLNRITGHLDAHPERYEFVSISLGPDLPVDDDEVTAWTAELDRRFARENILALVAAGNGGDRDRDAGLHRVQPPADGVNVLTVGAASSRSAKWERADYSCMGPGRTPGIVKPDGLAFGGSDSEPFMLLSSGTPLRARPDSGTSYATPSMTRQAAAARVHLGPEPSPLAIHALLIHRAEAGNHEMEDVGWGRFEQDPMRLITCEDHEVVTIFQGQLPTSQYIRAPVPMPLTLKGSVWLRATIVIAPAVDPGYPGSYTRSGLEVSFRPHSLKYGKGKDGKRPKHAQTKPFFAASNMYNAAEYELRKDGCKWEPCFHGQRKFKADSLHKPCFDIEYQHRELGAKASAPQPIPYAMIVSVRAPDVADLYNQVVRAYASRLTPLRPRLRVPVRSSK